MQVFDVVHVFEFCLDLAVAINGQTGAIDGATAIDGQAMACIDGGTKENPTSMAGLTLSMARCVVMDF